MKAFVYIFFVLLTAQAFAEKTKSKGDNYDPVFDYDYDGGIFKLEAKDLPTDNSEGEKKEDFFSVNNLLVKLNIGQQYYRFDPKNLTDNSSLSAYSSNNIYTSLEAEYFLFRNLSVFVDFGTENLDVFRYDGLTQADNNLSLSSSSYGLHLNWSDFYLGFSQTTSAIPLYEVSGGDITFYTSNLNGSSVDIGQRHTVMKDYILQIRLNHTEYSEFQHASLGVMSGNEQTLSFSLFDKKHWRFGLSLYERRQAFKSATNEIKTKVIGITPIFKF